MDLPRRTADSEKNLDVMVDFGARLIRPLGIILGHEYFTSPSSNRMPFRCYYGPGRRCHPSICQGYRHSRLRITCLLVGNRISPSTEVLSVDRIERLQGCVPYFNAWMLYILRRIGAIADHSLIDCSATVSFWSSYCKGSSRHLDLVLTQSFARTDAALP